MTANVLESVGLTINLTDPPAPLPNSLPSFPYRCTNTESSSVKGGLWFGPMLFSDAWCNNWVEVWLIKAAKDVEECSLLCWVLLGPEPGFNIDWCWTWAWAWPVVAMGGGECNLLS